MQHQHMPCAVAQADLMQDSMQNCMRFVYIGSKYVDIAVAYGLKHSTRLMLGGESDSDSVGIHHILESEEHKLDNDTNPFPHKHMWGHLESPCSARHNNTLCLHTYACRSEVEIYFSSQEPWFDLGELRPQLHYGHPIACNLCKHLSGKELTTVVEIGGHEGGGVNGRKTNRQVLFSC